MASKRRRRRRGTGRSADTPLRALQGGRAAAPSRPGGETEREKARSAPPAKPGSGAALRPVPPSRSQPAVRGVPGVRSERLRPAAITWRVTLHWLAVLAWMGVIFVASSVPDLRAIPVMARLGFLPLQLSPAQAYWLELIVRKTAHVLEYGVLAALILSATRATWPRLAGWAAARWSWTWATFYALGDEWHQRFVPGRDGRLTDVAIDAAGAALALWLILRRAARLRAGAGRSSRKG
ncbi:VanZ family protein [Caldinitratiruptor microaerophilus]|uniref:VanZ-like domain-containing protein n=1 Tax=Caldinitratiruptor microaerophilus TaxID=671077 RepID=A0AA35G7H2_9FIRM|nr:VanZ family protein [Caldinitratiruptor microaerophilus]BDG60096.1 hypothetical protein caldi_11860 [Caldinitratiruptor microaerophilus]